ncbi:Membrane-fusion protein [Cronobacter universalis NCTC 9529]|uniref:Protein of uncharacterized function (DUF2806) n=1 Tax=Cronobacter universalis NCTC 9529 TaxID=1074000 RepID=A0AAC8VSE4_9ENTR|nr:DUF2806 domain-containing protein [Cronobacter universalis]ALB56169.1 hypothetical protein AFK65_16420 [Cronobacter universalis NCTC 9529]CCK15699.1 Membrane-fusion protein [Cronobacter universalis NCTC 9529]STD14931.1 Protein of uncharacterised function (DUF2806) [Cronobacter universalis NCTC 9529]
MSVSKLVEKLWETVGAKSISALCKPGQIRREGLANIEIERKKMLILAQTEKEIEDIKSGKAIVSLNDFNNPKIISLEGEQQYDKSGSMEPYINMDSLTKTIRANFLANELQKEMNIANSLIIAEEILSTDQTEPTTEQIEDDWLYRWRDSASTSSSEKLQELWGRILAGEMKSPGSYSLRTIDFIKNLTQKEATQIQKLFSFVFFGNIIKNKEIGEDFNNEYLKEQLRFGFLSEMQALGVISGVESFGLTSTFKSLKEEEFYHFYIYNDKVMQITHNDPKKELILGVIILTPLGHELRSLCPVTIDSTYLNYVIELIKSLGFKITIGDYIEDTDGRCYSRNNVEV